MKSNKSGLNHVNRWLVAAIVGIVVYGLSQPYLNATFGWQLPSIAQLAGDSGQAVAVDETDSTIEANTATPESQQGGTVKSDTTKRDTPQTSPRNNRTSEDQVATKEASPGGGKAGESASPNDPPATESLDPLSEYLKETPPGSENYVSPEGLRYTRGSEEGHRIKHLERHLKDQPNRPGKHGVFNGDLLQVLQWLDEAYVRGKNRDKGTSQRTEDGRTVYEVTFDAAIGYVGGQAGGRSGKPKAKRIRLVVERDRVITAFPF